MPPTVWDVVFQTKHHYILNNDLLNCLSRVTSLFLYLQRLDSLAQLEAIAVRCWFAFVEQAWARSKDVKRFIFQSVLLFSGQPIDALVFPEVQSRSNVTRRLLKFWASYSRPRWIVLSEASDLFSTLCKLSDIITFSFFLTSRIETLLLQFYFIYMIFVLSNK